MVGLIPCLKPIFDSFEPAVRVETVQRVLQSITDPDELQDLMSVVTIHDGVQSTTKFYWIFMFLCLAAKLRAGSSPLDIANDIVKAHSAKGILL